nr:ribonuclease H-like domain-containing protein [Tanacetum cinerariifolium]
MAIGTLQGSNSSATNNIAKPGCQTHCGNITVPYPFGIGKDTATGPTTNFHPKPIIEPSTSILPPRGSTQPPSASTNTTHVIVDNTPPPASIFVSQISSITNVNPNLDSIHLMVTHFRVGTNRPTQHFTLHVSSVSPLPKSYKDVFNDPNWLNTMSDEYNALLKNNTWTLMPRPTDANIVRYMWLFRHKYLVDGTFSPYKARLMANGTTHVEGVDFDETFSLVVKPCTIQIVLSLAISRHWPVHQLDVNNAFLHDDLSETVYMHQSPDFRDSTHPNYKTDTAYLLLNVVDIVLTASFEKLLQRIISSLHQEFSKTDLGHFNYFLGIFVMRDASGMFLSQQAEYRGVANAIAETFWLRNLLRELHTPLSSAMLVYYDNEENMGTSSTGPTASESRPDMSFASLLQNTVRKSRNVSKGCIVFCSTPEQDSVDDVSYIRSFNPRAYAFAGEENVFKFNDLNDLKDTYFIERIESIVPVVLEWAIGNLSFLQAEATDGFSCQLNSECISSRRKSITLLSERYVNSAYGFFLGKRVAYPVVANYAGNTWGKYGLVKSMLNSSTGLFFFQFSSMDGFDSMLENAWVKLYGVPQTASLRKGRSGYARPLIEIRADVEFKDTIVAPKGVPVGSNVGFKPTKEYTPVAKKPNANTSCNKKKGVEPTKKKLEKLIIKGKVTLVDDDLGNHDSNNELFYLFELSDIGVVRAWRRWRNDSALSRQNPTNTRNVPSLLAPRTMAMISSSV